MRDGRDGPLRAGSWAIVARAQTSGAADDPTRRPRAPAAPSSTAKHRRRKTGTSRSWRRRGGCVGRGFGRRGTHRGPRPSQRGRPFRKCEAVQCARVQHGSALLLLADSRRPHSQPRRPFPTQTGLKKGWVQELVRVRLIEVYSLVVTRQSAAGRPVHSEWTGSPACARAPAPACVRPNRPGDVQSVKDGHQGGAGLHIVLPSPWPQPRAGPMLTWHLS